MLVSVIDICSTTKKEIRLNPALTQTPPSKLIQDFVHARRQLSELQQTQADTHMALHGNSLRIVNEIFDELRTVYPSSVTKHAEYYILDIEEHLAKIIIIVRFATKKDMKTIPDETKKELMKLYQEIAQKAIQRFFTLDNAFIIRPIFA